MGYAIITRYHGPTNYRGSRVIGTGPAITMDDHAANRYTRATVSWDYGAGNPARDGEPAAYGGAYDGWGDSDANHRRAADAVAARLRDAGWDVTLAPEDRGASLPDESGRVYVLRYSGYVAPDPAAVRAIAATSPEYEDAGALACPYCAGEDDGEAWGHADDCPWLSLARTFGTLR